MTDAPSQIEWYLARDGQQYGPLNEAEMRAFVDLGHLKESDLLWRAGFPDWRPAPDVFAILAATGAPVAAAVAPVAAPDTAPPPAHLEQPEAAIRDPLAALANAAPAAAAAPVSPAVTDAPLDTPVLLSPDQLRPPAADPEPYAAVAAAQITPVEGPRQPAPPRRSDRGPLVQPGPASQPAQRRRSRDASGEPRRRIGIARIAAALVFALLIGGLMAAVLKGDQLTALLSRPLASLVSIAAGGDNQGAPKVTPLISAGGTPEEIDRSFQQMPVWREVKAEFPDWYAERLREAARLAADKRGDAQVTKQLTEALVALRRKHADQALTASPERLKFVATAFLDNLQSLAKQSIDTCYGFISQGETYPAVLAMLQKPDSSALLQAQIVAVFQAIADGRKTPRSYLPPRKTDYDALAAELQARGWSEDDMRMFSDPRALGRASPQQVCKMVQDWFAAQISIKDSEAQMRLLVESLRPVVAG